MDLDTVTYTELGSDGKTWFKVILDKVHCVEKVIRFNQDGSPLRTRSCSENDCSKCEGKNCNLYTLTVKGSDLAPVSGCKHGDTVVIDRLDLRWFKVCEIAIVGRPSKPQI